MRVKVAVTVSACIIVIAHRPVPVQAPPQPPNVAVGSGVAVNTTTAPISKGAWQMAPHKIPSGSDVTLPEPCFVTVSGYVMRAKVAVTKRTRSTTSTHGPTPVHAPDQPVKVLVGSAVAVSVIDVPES